MVPTFWANEGVARREKTITDKRLKKEERADMMTSPKRLRIADCGLRINCGTRIAERGLIADRGMLAEDGSGDYSAIRNPQSSINPQSAIRDPQYERSSERGGRCARSELLEGRSAGQGDERDNQVV